MGFFKNIFSVSFLTMLSRVAGFIRDQITAYFLGSTYLSQAFLLALRIPNTFREMFAEGAFASSFIPTLSKINDEKKKKNFLNDSFSYLTIALIILSAIFMIFMPTVIRITAPGFTGEKFDTTITLARIMFPYLLLISLTTFFISIMQSFKKFAIPAFTPIIFNLTIIASIFMFNKITPNVGYALSWGVFLSGVIQLAFIYYFVKKLGISIKFTLPKLTRETKDFLLKFFPALAGAGIYYLNILVASIFSSLFDGAVSWFYFAQRIYLLPIGIIGVAISTVLLPHLSSNLQTDNSKEKNFLQNNSFLLNLLLGLPCAAAMFFLSFDIVQVLFQRGLFNLNDTVQTALILKILSLNVVIILFNRIFAGLFFARGNTKIPATIALISFIANLVFLSASIFIFNAGFLVIASSTIISSLIPFVIYLFLIIKKKYTHLKRDIWKKAAIILFANILLGSIFLLFANSNLSGILKITSSALIGFFYLIYIANMIFRKKIKS